MAHSPSSDPQRPNPPKTQPSRKARCLSPNEALLYLRPRTSSVTRHVDEERLLASKQVDRIPTEGIKLGKSTFWCPDLQPYVTDPQRGAVRRSFLILYDAAELANNRLEEVRLYEVDSAGRRTPLMIVPNLRTVRRGYSNGQFIRELDRHERITESKVAKARDVFGDLMLGRAAREQLREDQAARRVGGRPKRSPRRPDPDMRTDPSVPPEDSAFRKALNEREDSPAGPLESSKAAADSQGNGPNAGHPSLESKLSALFGDGSAFEEPPQEEE